ncbi:MAG TPA: ABC transporter ATP-binding protein [Geminicoccaceae bacterium]|nr:ABC transporter ATP-binding protein [Geminicoccaceae bacterium]
MAEPVLATEGLSKRFGGLLVTDRVHLELMAGETLALIGPNGAGKTTLLDQLTGELAPDAGRVLLRGRDVTALPSHARARLGIGRSFQITSIFPTMSVLDNVALAVQAHAGTSFRFWRDAARDRRLTGPAHAMLERLGLAALADRPAGALAHGQKRRLELAMTLAGEPGVLLLDEPMAGMGPEESLEMVELLRGLGGRYAMLLVEHDMDAVFQLADRILVLVYGRIIASGAPAAIRADAEVRRAYLGDEATG